MSEAEIGTCGASQYPPRKTLAAKIRQSLGAESALLGAKFNSAYAGSCRMCAGPYAPGDLVRWWCGLVCHTLCARRAAEMLYWALGKTDTVDGRRLWEPEYVPRFAKDQDPEYLAEICGR